MKDRYLYRAKRTDNGKWVEGAYFKRRTGKYAGDKFVEEIQHIIIIDMSSGGYQFAVIDPYTICQCTGREDEWEHDIFQYDEERYEIQFCKESLTWEAVSIFSSESIGLGEFSSSEYVRIGNSIDNPEMLEVGE